MSEQEAHFLKTVVRGAHGALEGVDDCGCRIIAYDNMLPLIRRCPLHAAAPELLAALEAILEHEHKTLSRGGNYLLDADRVQAREAIRQAKGEG